MASGLGETGTKALLRIIKENSEKASRLVDPGNNAGIEVRNSLSCTNIVPIYSNCGTCHCMSLGTENNFFSSIYSHDIYYTPLGYRCSLPIREPYTLFEGVAKDSIEITVSNSLIKYYKTTLPKGTGGKYFLYGLDESNNCLYLFPEVVLLKIRVEAVTYLTSKITEVYNCFNQSTFNEIVLLESPTCTQVYPSTENQCAATCQVFNLSLDYYKSTAYIYSEGSSHHIQVQYNAYNNKIIVRPIRDENENTGIMITKVSLIV